MFLAEIFGYLLNFLYDLLHSYGISIIIFSIIVRIILIPITINQQKSMKKTNKIQKEIKIIQNKYKNNPEKLNQETMELYKREKMNPLSGCFSAIIQIFIILSVFWLVSSPLTYMKKVKELDIYKEYETKVAENSSTKSSYKEIAMINLVEKDYIQISEQLKNENIENMIIAKQNEISKISNFKRTLYEDWKNKDITREEYLEYKQKYENDIERLKENIKRLENEKQKYENQNQSHNAWIEKFKNQKGIAELSRDIMMELIDCIYVHENGNITIKFKFEDEFKRCLDYIENNKNVLLKQVVNV